MAKIGEATAKIQSGGFHETHVTTDYGRLVVEIAARLKKLQEEVVKIAEIEGWVSDQHDSEDYRYFLQSTNSMHSMLCSAAMMDTKRTEIGKKGIL